eukprot:5712361-Pyramimonas_sp.AAC.1
MVIRSASSSVVAVVVDYSEHAQHPLPPRGHPQCVVVHGGAAQHPALHPPMGHPQYASSTVRRRPVAVVIGYSGPTPAPRLLGIRSASSSPSSSVGRSVGRSVLRRRR